MYESMRGADVVYGILVMIGWAIAAWRLGKLPRRTEPKRLRRAALWTLIWFGIAGLAVLAKGAGTAQLAGHGWEFASDRVLLVLPLIVVPAVLAFVWTVPAVWRARRGTRTADGEVPAAARAGLATPKVGLPPRLTAIGGLIAVWTSMVWPAVVPLWDEWLVYGAVYLAAGALYVLALRGATARILTGAARPRPARRLLTGAVAVVLVAAGITWAWADSRLPDRYSMVDHGTEHGAAGHHERPGGIVPAANESTLSITELTGPRDGVPDQRYTLTAQTTRISLPSGATVEGWTFNGTVPGPLLRARQGELVEVELINKDVPAGVTAHWHGIDVPNAEDGVPGMTQDAVPPGGRHVYRFRVPDAGTFWYHSHQVSAEQVRRGLYGAFIVDPASAPPAAQTVRDIPVLAHVFPAKDASPLVLNASDQLQREAVPAGTTVRLRLFNTDHTPHTFTLAGTEFRVTAVDGGPVNEPTAITGQRLKLGGGGRYDVEFTMPAAPVRLVDVSRPDAGLLISPDGKGDRAADTGGAEFDPTTYGSPLPVPFDAGTRYDHSSTWYLDDQFGFFDGRFTVRSAVNGLVFPDVPPIQVREGELVKMRFVNRSFQDHPMHLHGHHVLVLSRNDKPATGSPLWLDTVNVPIGEVWEIAFKADNPGLWMDHCHNLDHAANGMVMHLTYAGYTTPFLVGGATPNQPE